MNKDYKPINNLWKDSKGYRYFGTLKLSSKIKYDGDDFIPLWEWINQLQQENKKLNGAIQTYDILLKSNIEENKQLKAQIEEYQKALDEIENILNACGEMACYTKSRCLLEEDIDDIEEIIQKAKGDVKNENNNI